MGECGISVLDYESLYINLVGALIYNIRRSTYTKIPALFALESESWNEFYDQLLSVCVYVQIKKWNKLKK